MLQRLAERGVKVDEFVIPDDVHDFLLWRSWRTVAAAVASFFEKTLLQNTVPTRTGAKT